MSANFTSETPTDLCYRPTSLELINSRLIQWAILALYLLTALISILGNGIVLAVQLSSRKWRHSMRIYLCNLAIADIALSLMSMPFTYSNIVLGHWPHPHWLCPLAQFFQLLTAFVTSTTLSIIGLERYTVTIHPLSTTATWFKSHHLQLLLPTWLFGSLYASIPLFHTTVSSFTFGGIQYYQCTYRNTFTATKLNLYNVIHFILTFIVPLLIIAFAYLTIISKLKHTTEHFITIYNSTDDQANCILVNHREPSNSPTENLKKINVKHSKTIKMLLAVVVAYCICWLPLKLYQLLLNLSLFKYCTSLQFHLFLYSYLAFHWLAMANSFVNPIIYNLMSKRFRRDLQKVLSVCFKFCCPNKANCCAI